MRDRSMGRRGKDPAFERAYAFALEIVALRDQLAANGRPYVLLNQLLRSGTSVGANLAEAASAFSNADLASKVSIAYKECQESKYWLNLLCDSGHLPELQAEPLLERADEIGRILYATLRTLRRQSTINGAPAARGSSINDQ